MINFYAKKFSLLNVKKSFEVLLCISFRQNVQGRKDVKNVVIFVCFCSVALESDRTDQYTQAINRYVTPQTQLVVCMLPNNRKDRYDAIKKLCCVDRPGKLSSFHEAP